MVELFKILDEYSNQFGDLANRSVAFCQAIPEKLQFYGNVGKNLHVTVSTWLSAKKSELQEQILDFSPMGSTLGPYKLLLNVYFWASICLLSASFGHFLGSNLAAFLVHRVFNANYAALTAFCLYPLAAYWTIRRSGIGFEERASHVLHFAFFCSLLIGFLLKNHEVPFMPPPFFIPTLVTAVLSIYVGPLFGHLNRLIFLSLIFASSLLLAIFAGSATHNIGSTYKLWALLLCCLGVVDFQLTVGRMWKDGVCINSDQVLISIRYIIFSSLMTYQFGAPSGRGGHHEDD